MAQNANVIFIGRVAVGAGFRAAQPNLDPSQNLITTPAGSSFVNYSTAQAGAQVKTGAGVLDKVIVNTGGAGSTVTLYDGTTTAGTVIGIFGSATEISLDINVAFSTGLFAVLAGGTPANVTITYR